ncbi:MAG: YtxH domain-containing protein [Acidimicrobiales bacterium]
MRFRLGVVTGFAGGYYLGTRAGQERYEQINQLLRKARRSDAFEAAAEKTKAVVEESVDIAREKAQDLVDSRQGNGQSDGAPAT